MLVITGRKRTATDRDQAFYSDAEAGIFAGLAATGVLRLALRRVDGRGFVLLIEPASRTAGLALLGGLPSIEMEVVDYRVLEVEPVNIACCQTRWFDI